MSVRFIRFKRSSNSALSHANLGVSQAMRKGRLSSNFVACELRGRLVYLLPSQWKVTTDSVCVQAPVATGLHPERRSPFALLSLNISLLGHIDARGLSYDVIFVGGTEVGRWLCSSTPLCATHQ